MPNETTSLKGRVWPEGTAFWFIHGVRVTQQIVEAPETMTAKQISEIDNAEIRRIAIERFGEGRFISELGVKPIARDDWGELFRAELPGDEPLVLCRVKNYTPEPDGSARVFFLRVDPQCRLMFGNGKYGEAQKLTPLNAIGSTWGLTGDEYAVIQQHS